jgi:DNA-binding transcriptional ArsR family regulator
VLRIHFTATDLARTRVAPTLGPLAETLLATRLLQHDDSDPFHGWRQQARRHTPLHTSPLGWLYGGNGYLPDLFTIVGRVDSLDKGLDALLAAPASLLRGELDILADQRPLPAAAQVLATGDRAARIELIAAIRQVHDAAIGPRWGRLRAYLDATDAGYGRLLASGGVERLLAGIHPLARWQPPVLEIGSPHRSRDVSLRGRGLVLIPSVFCWPAPMAFFSLADQAAPFLLLVPAVRDLADFAAALTAGERQARALVALLGRTRAAVLEAVADGCTTSELARRVGVSLAAASQHAQVLRDSGLLVTRRAGKSVHHNLTGLGVALLNAASPDPRSPC